MTDENPDSTATGVPPAMPTARGDESGDETAPPAFAAAPTYPPPPPPVPTGPPPGWGGPPVGWVPASPTNGFAIAALVCGIVGLLCMIPSVLAIIFGSVARRQIEETGQAGAGMATAGLVCGIIGTALWAVFMLMGMMADA